MNQPVYLKPWLSGWNLGSLIALFFVLLSAIVSFVTFALSQNYVVAYLGAQPEDISFSIQICYAGILTALPIQARFLRYFEMKYYVAFFLLTGILLSGACLYVTDIFLFFVIRYLQGIVVCSIAASILTLIPGFLKLEFRQVVSSTIFYGTVLSSSVLIAVIAAQVSLNSDFTNIYHYLILIQIVALLIVLLGFNGQSNLRRYPLYQIDWTATVFFAAAAISVAYLMVYGSKYYWFTDQRIVMACVICLTASGLYIYRCLHVKRPLVELTVFRYPKFCTGLVLLIMYYGMKESINLIFGYTASVLQWSAPQVVELALCNIAGLITFMTLSAAIMVRKKGIILYFLLFGFSTLLIYHLWIFIILTPDLAFDDLLLPLFFQGAASGLLFVPIMLFILTAVPPTTGITGLAIAACARFTALLNASTGFYNLQLYYNQLFRESFLFHLSSLDQFTAERLNDFKTLFISKGYAPDQAAAMANVYLSKALGQQGQLLTIRASFLFVACLIGCILGLVFVVMLINRLRRQYLPANALSSLLNT